MPRKATQAETPEGAAAQAAAPPPAPSAPGRKIVLVDNKPKQRTPPEWGMLAMKVKTIVEEERNESGRVIRHVRLECKELDEAVLMSRNNDYTKYDSNGIEHYFTVTPTVVFVPQKEIESCERAGFVVSDDQPDWRLFKLRAE